MLLSPARTACYCCLQALLGPGGSSGTGGTAVTLAAPAALAGGWWPRRGQQPPPPGSAAPHVRVPCTILLSELLLGQHWRCGPRAPTPSARVGGRCPSCQQSGDQRLRCSSPARTAYYCCLSRHHRGAASAGGLQRACISASRAAGRVQAEAVLLGGADADAAPLVEALAVPPLLTFEGDERVAALLGDWRRRGAEPRSLTASSPGSW